MITLKTRIEIQDHINPICLPEPSSIRNIEEKEDSLTLSGFGLFKNPNTGRWETPTFLQMTEGLSMSFYPNFIRILSQFYPDFISTLPKQN